MIGLNEDLSKPDVFTHSHQSLLHGLSRPQDRNTRYLEKQTFLWGLLERCSLSGPENTKRFKIYVHLNLRLLQIFTYVQNYHLKLNVLLL